MNEVKAVMIAYIVKLLEAASPEAVRKLFICATNICGSKGGAADEQ